MGRGPNRGKGGKLNRGAWTALEDKMLTDYVTVHGDRRWSTVAREAGLHRCAKSCRLRWLNYLRPDIKRGNITKEEEDLIIRLHKLLGNRWSLIAGRLPGRTDNEIKNYWHSHLAKKQKVRKFDNKIVNNQKKMNIEKYSELEKPSDLLRNDITMSRFLNGSISLDHARLEDESSKLEHSKSGIDRSPMMTVEGSGQFKMDLLVEDFDLSGINIDISFTRLCDYEASLIGSTCRGRPNEAGEDFFGHSWHWLPEGFLDNWSSEFASREDWNIM
ncbi:transcription factor WER-like [Punica granatum]|uniref:Uncharacterized protein n=2 Tax=Punica granatum TaxID=22663 RepID=A0A218XFW1_PUNGR|nr:transcription factor WER-like [Punica granatum]OWM84115.1 hypothetical protein CDL15_Pgr009362 [Punica granatum]PKI79019.1 hypothetical protein CRG98_000592 [Punica granatum]